MIFPGKRGLDATAGAERATPPVRGHLECRVARFAAVLALFVCGACANSRVARVPSADEIRSRLVGGTWVRHLDDRTFRADGTFESYERGRNYPTRGTWRVEGDELSLTAEHETTRHRILVITPTKLDMTFGAAGQQLHYTRASADR